MSLVITGFAFPAGAQVPTLETIANWQDTGVTVDVFTPSGWSAADPTVVFSHGDGASPIQYHCYREIWAEHGIRTISPYEANGTDTAGRQARWTEVSSVHRALSQLQDPRHIFFAGHSFGAYATLLAAGADSRVVGGQAGNCLGDECPALPAQGYVILSGQPAQNAVNPQPYWFGTSAFDHLAPRRYVAYGTADYSPLDACMASGSPACRGDSYTIDSTRAADLGLELHAQDGFTHLMFVCGPNWRTTHTAPAAIQALGDDIARWIASVSEGSTIFTETSRLALRDDHVDPIHPKRRTVTFTVRSRRSAPGNRVVVPARGSTGDPTLHGGTLIVANSAGSNERVRVELPAAGWRLLGTSLQTEGLRVSRCLPHCADRHGDRQDRRAFGEGHGPGWTYTLDEAPQGRVGVRVRLGDVAWCADAAARTSGTPPSSTRFDHVDKFDGATVCAPAARVPDLRHAVARGAPSTYPPVLRRRTTPVPSWSNLQHRHAHMRIRAATLLQASVAR